MNTIQTTTKGGAARYAGDLQRSGGLRTRSSNSYNMSHIQLNKKSVRKVQPLAPTHQQGGWHKLNYSGVHVVPVSL